jgi:ABC-type enterochelin transport system permease subunit
MLKFLHPTKTMTFEYAKLGVVLSQAFNTRTTSREKHWKYL